ncbi:MAG: hypothetical protein ACR2PX_15365 [Endozoicomonas sp.]|uniref:hypothetical protein n=1 Tax=Endozoicomonas sp. TaxID=1892382 RepID=UPI003D9B7726
MNNRMVQIASYSHPVFFEKQPTLTGGVASIRSAVTVAVFREQRCDVRHLTGQSKIVFLVIDAVMVLIEVLIDRNNHERKLC